jgi:hypothetical protein
MPSYSALSLPATETLSIPATPVAAAFPNLPVPASGDWTLSVNLATDSAFPVQATIEAIQAQPAGDVVLASTTVTLSGTPTDYPLTVSSTDQQQLAFGACNLSDISVNVTPSAECCSTFPATLHSIWHGEGSCEGGPNDVNVDFEFDSGSGTWLGGTFTLGMATVFAYLTCDPSQGDPYKLTLHVSNSCAWSLSDVTPTSGSCSPVDYEFFILGFYSSGPGSCCPGTATSATITVTA